METFLLLASLLTIVGFLMIPVSRRLGAPFLLAVLAIGMLAGEDGPGGINFDSFGLAYAVGGLALAIILFAGGVETRVRDLDRAKLPALLLSSVGVLITACLVGLVGIWVFGIGLFEALLLGAVVGSTDAAATFLLIRQNDIGLKPRLESTLVLESGINDPMAIFLTIVLTSLVGMDVEPNVTQILEFLPMLLLQFGLGGVFGIAGGILLSMMLNRLNLSKGVYPALAVTAAIGVYAGTALLGGSGFLAAYLCGIVVRERMKAGVSERVIEFSEAMQWLCQIALFLMLGLLVTPTSLPAVWWQATVISLALIFVARPMAVFACLSWLGFTVREQLFVSWVGLRGAVPIFLAILPVIAPGPLSVGFFNVVFVIVVTSLILQGWTVSPMAKLFGVVQPKPGDETEKPIKDTPEN